MKVIVIGGGASGLAAALAAAESGADVTVLEHMNRVGKKILSTGNGRCNYSNEDLDPAHYNPESRSFVKTAFTRYSGEDTLAWFRTLGIWPDTEDGRIYPRSHQAASVLNAFLRELKYRDVDVHTECVCSELVRLDEGFLLRTNQGDFAADSVILAAGGKAAPKTGSDGSGYRFAVSLGHSLKTPAPALVQLETKKDAFRSIGGTRVNAIVRLFGNGELLALDEGEVQITAYGLSGIPVLQISRAAVRALGEKKDVCVLMDLFPEYSVSELSAAFTERLISFHGEDAAFLSGLLPKTLGEYQIRQLGTPLTDGTVIKLAEKLKGWKIPVVGSKGFSDAQVTQGGIPTAEVDPLTMESRIVPGFYLAGEVLDVDGECGGYNLQWAFTSGRIAGRSAARKRAGDSA